MEAITKEEMQAYEDVRQSGVTNMFHIPAVIKVAEMMSDAKLTKEKCIFIMTGNHYNELLSKHNIKRG